MLDLKYLEDLDEVLAHQIAEHPPEGEDWHDYYRTYPELFQDLIHSEVETERLIYNRFVALSEKVEAFVNWDMVEKAKLADEDFLIPLDDDGWVSFGIELQEAIIEGLSVAIEAGGVFTELETGIVIGWSSKNSPAQNFLRKHSFDLVKGLNKTTRKSMGKALRTSIDLGEDKFGTIARIKNIVKNRKRAEAIAHTETVRAYSQGRLEVAEFLEKEMDLKVVKTWRDNQPGACPICRPMHKQKVKRDELFHSKTNDQDYSAPPAHPNCKCGMSIDVISKS